MTDTPSPLPTFDGEWICREMVLKNQRGLHARASSKFVTMAESFSQVAEVSVTRGGETVSGLSIMGLLMLGAAVGSSVNICARGPGAQEALDAIAALIEDRFGEEM